MEDREVIREELAGFLESCYNGSFSQLVCDYIHSTGMNSTEVKELLEAMRKTIKKDPFNISQSRE